MQIYNNNVEMNSSFTHQATSFKDQVSSIKKKASSFITYILSLILLFAGISKIIDPTSLINNLSSVFPFLPETIVVLISSLLPLVEIGLGAALLVFGIKGIRYRGIKAVLISTVVLFGIFFFYSTYGFIQGSTNDCGCFGNVVKSSFGWGMIGRNLVLFLSSIFIIITGKSQM